jgi:phage terminase small subunit
MPRLSDKQRVFVRAYAQNPNATRAARAAGYSAHTAKQQGSRLLSYAAIRAAIDVILRRTDQAAEISIERVKKEVARIAFGDRRKLWNEDGSLKMPHELDDEAAALLASLETEELHAGRGEERREIGLVRKVKTWDKGRALEQCISILGMHKTASPGEPAALNLTIRLSSDKGR